VYNAAAQHPMDDQASTVIEAFIGNPFATDPRVASRGAEVAARLDLGASVRGALRTGEVETAKLLVLAYGHWQARENPDDPAHTLPRNLLPTAVWGKLPRKRSAYLRIVMAAGRAHRALTAIRGASPAMARLRRDVWSACFGDTLRNALDLERVIRDHDVLLLGETGTGKERLANALRQATPGPVNGEPAPFASVNAAAVPETLVESALFGHVKGAFTGADDVRRGLLRSASGGAFFLDEIGDLPATTQVKLLRVMETNEVFPLGSDESHRVDVRYIAATHKNLEAMVAGREFRGDLFQRFAGIVVRIPPLRERPEDMVEIGHDFLRRYLPDDDHPLIEPIETWLASDEALSHTWPGNVRELQNVLRSMMLGLEPVLGGAPEARAAASAAGVPESIREARASADEVDEWYLRRVLQACDNNLTRAAIVLGIDRSTVRRRARALRTGG